MNEQNNIVTVQDLNLETPKKLHVAVNFSLWIRALLQNWRQGTVKVKGRADVARSGKKPWKQKGTGRARAGTARSPIWRGGGVTFGPQPRVRSLKIAKKMKKGVLCSLLFKLLENDRVINLPWSLEGDKPNTSAAYKLLKNAGLHDQKVTVLVPAHDNLTSASFMNIPSVSVVFFDQVNAYDMVRSNYLVVFAKDLDSFKETAQKWI